MDERSIISGLFQEWNKKYALPRVDAKILRKRHDVLDTGAGPNLVCWKSLPLPFQRRIRPESTTSLRATNRQEIKVDGTVMLHIRLGPTIASIVQGPTQLRCDYVIGRFLYPSVPKRYIPTGSTSGPLPLEAGHHLGARTDSRL